MEFLMTAIVTRTLQRGLRSVTNSLQKNSFAYKLIAPAIIAMLIVHFIPMGWGIHISFRDLSRFNIRDLSLTQHHPLCVFHYYPMLSVRAGFRPDRKQKIPGPYLIPWYYANSPHLAQRGLSYLPALHAPAKWHRQSSTDGTAPDSGTDHLAGRQ
jgi:hypothetical protein